jgi:hypothetical protein
MRNRISHNIPSEINYVTTHDKIAYPYMDYLDHGVWIKWFGVAGRPATPLKLCISLIKEGRAEIVANGKIPV